MKTKNTFKPSDIQYDPIKPTKRPFWMHSVEQHDTNRKVSTTDILGIIAILGVIGMFYLMLG